MKLPMNSAITILLVCFCIAQSTFAFANACDMQTERALAQQRSSYVNEVVSLAEKNFSRLKTPFASLTCLDRLMQQNGVDLFFKPPSLDSLISKVEKNFCERANEIFDQIEDVELDFGISR